MGALSALKNLSQETLFRIGASALSRHKIDQAQRIFERGECANGTQISSRRKARQPLEGDYSRQHGKERRRKGRQTNYVDLELTGRHRNSLIVGEDSNGNPAYGFSDERQRKIAEGHTNYRKKDIYGSSEDELSNIKKTAVAEARAILRQAFAS